MRYDPSQKGPTAAGKEYFVDHTTMTTTWDDPRTQLQQDRSVEQQAGAGEKGQAGQMSVSQMEGFILKGAAEAGQVEVLAWLFQHLGMESDRPLSALKGSRLSRRDEGGASALHW